jgi:hypothetical protein
MRVSLETFFESMLPFLEGRVGVAQTVRALGPSPSGNARLALYPKLIRRQKRSVLDGFFASARAACDALAPRLWDRLIDQFIDQVAPAHWEPNHYAQQLLVFFTEKQGLTASVPPVVLELGDFAWIRFSAMIAELPQGTDLSIGRALFVRYYANEVAKFALAVEDGSAQRGALPEASACTLLVCRSRHNNRLEIVRPSLGALMALRRREAPTEPLRLPHGLLETDVDREDAALVTLGVLAPRPPSLDEGDRK